MEYGKIENGILMSANIEPLRIVSGGVEKIVSVEEQLATAERYKDLKPVDDIEPAKLTTDKENYTVQVVPYDNGDRISYHYNIVKDVQHIESLIEGLKLELSDSDYKVIKCYEASLTGVNQPYDMQEIVSQRAELREKINSLENELTK